MQLPLRALIGLCFCFAGTFLVLFCLRHKLPQDHGRAFAINGKQSVGKARGSGVLFIPVFAAAALLLLPFSRELLSYLLRTLGAMLTGYLDDRSSLPWGELKKGLLDLAICVCAVAVFMLCNDKSELCLFSLRLPLPRWLFALFAVFVLWAFINCCNCSDGVDGHFGTLAILSLGAVSYSLLSVFGKSEWALSGFLLIAAICAYLLFNASPSLVMMGDAGSRAIGLYLGLLMLKTDNMLLCVPFACVILLDGGLGLIKLSVRRLFHSKTFMSRPLTPLHDDARKNRHWSDTQTVFRFALLQLFFCLIGILCLYL